MTELYNRTDNDIVQDILSDIPSKYQKTVGAPIWDFVQAVSKEIKKIWDTANQVILWQDVNNMSGDFLKKWCFQRRGILYKDAVASKTVLTGTGSDFTVEAGMICGESENGLQFICTETVKSNDGIAYIPVECTVKGSLGNLPAGSITKIPVTIEGLSTILNENECTGGYNEEGEEALKKRYIEDLQMPITSGNIYHYKKWAKECAGVFDAKIKPLWNGDNTVKVILLCNDNLIPSDELVKTVQDYIDPFTEDTDGEKIGWGEGNGQAPCGAYCTVSKPDILELDIKADIELKTGAELDIVKNNVKNSINEYLKEIAFKQNFVSYTRISACILSSEGIKDHAGMKLNNGIDNLLLIDNDITCEIAVLAKLELTLKES